MLSAPVVEINEFLTDNYFSVIMFCFISPLWRKIEVARSGVFENDSWRETCTINGFILWVVMQ